MKEDRIRERRRDNIKEALRAKKFSEEETLKMGLDLIDFSLKLNRRVKVEED